MADVPPLNLSSAVIVTVVFCLSSRGNRLNGLSDLLCFMLLATQNGSLDVNLASFTFSSGLCVSFFQVYSLFVVRFFLNTPAVLVTQFIASCILLVHGLL
jgi:hypothetical protein